MYQKNLLYTKNLSPVYVKKLEYLFSLINYPKTGKSVKRRPPHPKYAILNALIFKNFRSINFFIDLSRELKNYPQLSQVCGFSSFPSRQRFSDYLKTTPNEKLQYVRLDLVKQLIAVKAISGIYISGDACPIKSNVKENNLKTTVKERFNKHKFPKGDPESRLGTYTIFFPKKKVQFFWGYRNHILNDCDSELPVAEITKPANIHESNMFIPQLVNIKREFNFPIKAV
ncbi:MAG: DDE transposase, partial [Elusimicrobiota bacterium]|nr:DDE transposase [Elusimicrobiota bacterium]